MPRFDGKVVIITGGAGILGRKFCQGFAEEGARVVAIDVDSASAATVAAEVGHDAYGIGCDISDPSSVSAAIDAVVDRFGGVDVLMNNAASKSKDVRAFFEPFETYSLDVWREVMSVNLDGVFLMSQAVGRQMLRQQFGGVMLNVASIYGLVGPDERIYEGSDYLGGPINTPAVYSASKAGVVGMTRWLATHYAKHNIRVNCLVPGGVSSGQNGPFQKKYSSRVPMERMAEAQELVGPALFLASQEASYVTGQIFAADGGWTAW
ncbi:MAG: SDR family oxidoreductase [Rhizobium sp.]|nr:SDR family oxidoreductase [Rhizobium sp.]MDM8013349.1 SDR family oxidoreductase [Rhizobium sp.]